ncbi:MAG: hypothetical protein HRT89_15055 [Lentisphaeria bacterium]|nr:hypothetical protein [Lentisphaeria bacterium]
MDEKAEIAALIEPWVHQAFPRSDSSPELQANLICADCQHPFNFVDMQVSVEGNSLVCSNCKEAHTVQATTKQKIAIFKSPGFYVLALIFFSIILWALGVGNPDEEKLSKQGKDLEFYMQVYPNKVLKQGRRTLTHAKYLFENGKEEEAKKWAALSQTCIEKALDYWKDENFLKYLNFMKANALFYQSEFKQAWEMISPMEKQFKTGSDNENIPQIRFIKACIAFKNGKVKDAGKMFDRLIAEKTDAQLEAEMPTSYNNQIDKYISIGEKGVYSHEKFAVLKGLCGLKAFEEDEIRHKALAYMTANQIVTEHYKKRMKITNKAVFDGNVESETSTLEFED